ncbi:TPA: hypothetical protein ACHJZV_005245, partial [Escherichia coli]
APGCNNARQCDEFPAPAGINRKILSEKIDNHEFPAPAGINRDLFLPGTISKCVPRGSGDKPGTKEAPFWQGSSSPRQWG